MKSDYLNGRLSLSIPAPDATQIFVCLFDGERETRRIALTRQGDVHVGIIDDLKPGDRYGLRAEGPWEPASGHRFDSSKLLVDPWASAIDRHYVFDPALCIRGHDTAALVPKSVVVGPRPPIKRARPRPSQWIYELAVRAFSMRHPGIASKKRGTIAALAEPAALDHFKRLGVDTIELMPLAAWIDERHLTALNLSNAWGYNPVTFMAPDPRLAPGGFAEIAHTVKILHENDIQVIVDVVLNHSGESDVFGPTLSFRGLGHATWYAQQQGQLNNDTGCGNTITLNHPLVMDYALQSLRHWVEATGIDGFRFDLASVMGRHGNGFRADAPLIRAIEQDPVLSQLILIAEPWDIGPGGYQLGHFPTAWLEWNDRYRDEVRRFWRGDNFSANAMATRLTGSSDLFAAKSPSRSVNFIAAHDGFTLADLKHFTAKNNMANGEDNRDGKSDEVTVPGSSAAALLATLFLSRGTPMLTAGDEFGRSQSGNNNAYAQDNDTTWLNWAGADQDLIAVTATLVALRKSHPLLSDDRFLSGQGDARWFDGTGESPDWSRSDNRYLGLVLNNDDAALAIVLNNGPVEVALPFTTASKKTWRRVFPAGAELTCPGKSVSLFVSQRTAR